MKKFELQDKLDSLGNESVKGIHFTKNKIDGIEKAINNVEIAFEGAMYSQQSYGFIKDFWQCYVSNFIRNGSKNLDLRKYYASFFLSRINWL